MWTLHNGLRFGCDIRIIGLNIGDETGEVIELPNPYATPHHVEDEPEIQETPVEVPVEVPAVV